MTFSFLPDQGFAGWVKLSHMRADRHSISVERLDAVHKTETQVEHVTGARAKLFGHRVPRRAEAIPTDSDPKKLPRPLNKELRDIEPTRLKPLDDLIRLSDVDHHYHALLKVEVQSCNST
eukprot:209250-Pyramimonas_sp.AAC.1